MNMYTKLELTRFALVKGESLGYNFCSDRFSIVKKMETKKDLPRALSELLRPRPLRRERTRQKRAMDIVRQRARHRARAGRGSRHTDSEETDTSQLRTGTTSGHAS